MQKVILSVDQIYTYIDILFSNLLDKYLDQSEALSITITLAIECIYVMKIDYRNYHW